MVTNDSFVSLVHSVFSNLYGEHIFLILIKEIELLIFASYFIQIFPKVDF